MASLERTIVSSSRSLLSQPLIWYIISLACCSTLFILSIYYAYTGPKISTWHRVLRSGSLPVDQFYSGLILSSVLAPIAFLIRQTFSDLASFHPFAIASNNAVSIKDFNRITDPGPLSLPSVAKYSVWRSLVQIVLMGAGCIFLPVGTLILTTGPFKPPTPGTDVVGMPTCDNSICPLRTAMNFALANVTSTHSFRPAFDNTDLFLDMAASCFKGSLLGRSDSIDLGAIPREIGGVPRSSLTYARDVTYHNVLTYSWASNCEEAAADIDYTITEDHGAQTVAFTFPDGSISSISLKRDVMNETARMFLNGMSSQNSNLSAGVNDTLYASIATLHKTPLTELYDAQVVNKTKDSSPILDRGVWIARGVCRPTFAWRVATCTWDGTYMRNCSSKDLSMDSGAVAANLDSIALDSLPNYMSLVLWKLYNDGDMLMTWGPYPAYAPTIQHVDDIYGVLAMSVVSVASMSLWGTTVVQTTGEPERQVYIVRLHILIVVSTMLTMATMLASLDLMQNTVSQQPTWKTNFLSITTAVRGQWWEQLFGDGGSVEWGSVENFEKCRVRFTADGSGRLIPDDEVENSARHGGS